MKKLIGVLVLMMVLGGVNAQINDPVQWTYTAKKIADKTYELHITATIGSNWHLYAQDAGEGPEPTKLTFTANPLISLDGKVKEVGKMEKSFDKNFNSTLKFYGKKVDFVQKIKVKSPVATVVKGSVNFMVCNDKQCLPPKDVPFSIKVGGK
jgi:DsbC/DsbD-like thiol-disulfide interchange protein